MEDDNLGEKPLEEVGRDIGQASFVGTQCVRSFLISSYLIPTVTCGVGIVIVIIHVRKLRFQWVEGLVGNHVAGDLNASLLAAEPTVFPRGHTVHSKTISSESG